MSKMKLTQTTHGIIIEGNLPGNLELELQEDTITITNPQNPQTAQHLRLPGKIKQEQALIMRNNDEILIAAPKQ